MRIAPINQNNSKKNTSFGILKELSISELSSNAQKVAQKVVTDEYIQKLSMDKNMLVFVKSTKEDLAKKKNVLLVRLVDLASKDRDGFYYSYSLGAKVKNNKIDNMKNNLVEDFKSWLNKAHFLEKI